MQLGELLDVENDGLPSLLWVTALILLYGNNSLNFFLYCITGRTFRNQLKEYFCRCRVAKPEHLEESISFSNYSLRNSGLSDRKKKDDIYVVPVSYKARPDNSRV